MEKNISHNTALSQEVDVHRILLDGLLINPSLLTKGFLTYCPCNDSDNGNMILALVYPKMKSLVIFTNSDIFVLT